MVRNTFAHCVQTEYQNVLDNSATVNFVQNMSRTGDIVLRLVPQAGVPAGRVVAFVETREDGELTTVHDGNWNGDFALGAMASAEHYRRLVVIVLLRETRARHSLKSLIRHIAANPEHVIVNVLEYDAPPLPHPIVAYRSQISLRVLALAWSTVGHGRGRKRTPFLPSEDDIRLFIDGLCASSEAQALVTQDQIESAAREIPPMPVELPILIGIAAAEDMGFGIPGGILSRPPDALGGMLLLACIRLLAERGVTDGWRAKLEGMMERVKERSKERMYGRPFNQLQRIHKILYAQV